MALILTVAGFVLPTWSQSFLVKGLPYLLWIAPSVLEMVFGVRAARSGDPQGRLVAFIALVVFALTTAAAFAMDWL